MKKEVDFLEWYPTAEAVRDTFRPQNWPNVIGKVNELANTPCPMLSQIDEVYNCEGLALSLIVAQFRGIHALSGTREPFNENSCRMIAELFLAKYGYQCTVFSLLAYFASYLSDYKVSYSQYDAQDIFAQYGRKFLPRWRDRIKPEEATKNEGTVTNDFSGLPFAWMLQGETAEEIREGWLYQHNFFTENDIREAELKINSMAF